MEPVALGLGIYGAVNASIALIDKIRSSLVDLKQRWKDAKNVPLQLNKLVKLSVQVRKVVEKIEAKLKSYPPSEREDIASGIIDMFQDKLQQNFKEAKTALESLDKYQESSRIRMAAKMKSIFGVMTKVETCLDEASDAASKIETHLKLEAIRPPQTEEEQFVPHFDSPELPDNMVLDFSSNATQEGRLLRKLLALCGKEHVQGVSAVGRGRGTATHGMGGVGKTTALRAICNKVEVQEAFPDGICFLEFGQDTKDGDIQRQLERCVRNFGGSGTLVEMKKQSSLEGAVYEAASWLRKKAILFVCDDLWRLPGCEFGYLPLLKRLLADAPSSKLLVSTRDQRIAEEVSLDCETFDTLLSDRPSARNLLGYIAFGKERIDLLESPDIQSYIETILDVCAGLQIALCMAGRALRTEMRRVGDIPKVFELYANQIQLDHRPDETQRGAQLYDGGLSYIIKGSLVQCERWAEKSQKKVNVENLFRSLSVLEKQMVMPKSMLSALWGLGSRETDRMVQKFADLGLITKTMDGIISERSSNETVEEYGVRLHDLVLVLCQEMTVDEEEERHGNVINALKRSKSLWIGEEIPTLPEWWNLKNNGYIFANLSRHMVKCGEREALATLLSDMRWTRHRVKVGGWLGLEIDFELLLAGSGYIDMRPVYEVLKRHWSEFREDERLLGYYIGGSLSGKDRKTKYAALYMDSMMEHLPRPFLIPRFKFLGPEDSREVSHLACVMGPDKACHMDISCSTGIAVWSCSDKISVWSLSARKELHCSDSWNGTYKNLVCCIAISANGESIVSGHEDGTFMRWDAGSGKKVGVEVKAHREVVTCLAISKDGSTIVTGSNDKTCRLWNAKNGEPKGIPMHHDNKVSCVAICESGSLIVSGSQDGTVCRWNMETCAMIGDPLCAENFWVTSVVLAENGKMIASGSYVGTLICWDAETGKQLGEPMYVGLDVTCIAISPCSKTILSGSEDGSLRMWDAVNGEQMAEPFRGHFDSVEFVEFTKEGNEIISGSNDGTIRWWSTTPSTQISEPTERWEGSIANILLANEGRKAVVSYRDDTLVQWDTEKGMKIGKPMKGEIGNLRSIAINEKFDWILEANFGFFVLWDSRTCEMVYMRRIVNEQILLTSVAVSSNGKTIVAGFSDGALRRYCAISGDELGEPMRGHKNNLSCVAFSPNDEMIVSGSRDGSIRRWVAASGEQIGKPLLHDEPIICLSVSGDGKFIVTATPTRSLFRWDAGSGQLISKFVMNPCIITDIWTNNDCTRIVTCANDRTITWWSVEPGGAILETSTLPLTSDVERCAIDMTHRVAAVGLWNGAVAFCDIHWKGTSK